MPLPTAPRVMTPDALAQGVAFINLLSFGSITVQLYGLYHDGSVGAPGLGMYPLPLPVDSTPFKSMWRALHTHVDLNPSQLLHAVGIAGILLSTLACLSTPWRCAPLLLLPFLLQLELMASGREFMAFQWDSLQLESTAVAALCLPLLPPLLNRLEAAARRHPHAAAGAVSLMRFTAFKLMLMSGVVKLTAGDSNWAQLTATATHMCTQCLPTPVAHVVHAYTPPLLHNAAVALTLLIEIPGAFLLIVPNATVARVGVVAQLALQGMIMATGNYNYFNLLTMVLCASAWPASSRSSTAANGNSVVMDAASHAGATSTGSGRRCCTLQLALELFGLAVATVLACRYMFTVYEHADAARDTPFLARMALGTTPALTPAALHATLTATLPYIVSYAAVFVCAHVAYGWFVTARHAVSAGVKLSSLLLLLQGTLTAVCVAVMFASSVQHLQSLVPGGSALMTPFMPINALLGTSRYLDGWHATHGYGLFRHMTGVGPAARDAYGVRRVTVDRPELDILFSHAGAHDAAWTSLAFTYKPGNISSAPRVNAPAQPRLDWQMWFAALGDASHAPFMFTLLEAVMEGHAPVYTLLDSSMHRREVVAGHEYIAPPLLTKVERYAYDCSPLSLTFNTTTAAPWMPRRSLSGAQYGTWWTRRHLEQYLPVLTRADRRLAGPLAQIGAPRTFVRTIMLRQQRAAQRQANSSQSNASWWGSIAHCADGGLLACIEDVKQAAYAACRDTRTMKMALGRLLLELARILARDPFQFAAYAYSHTHTPDGAPLVISRVMSCTGKTGNATVKYVSADEAAALRGDAEERDPLPPLLHASLAGSATYYTPSTLAVILFVAARMALQACWRGAPAGER